MSLVVTPITDLVIQDAIPTVLDLFSTFDDSLTTGLVARFELYNTSLQGGVTRVVLFDQPGDGAPLTVQNFQKYVNAGDYVNSIIHRAIPGFVVQGGGFTINGLAAVLNQTPNSGAAAVQVVPSRPPVQNEFSLGRSNLRGTIAMAKLSNQPNSATNQWFFNLANNSANLDNQNGGFTVFGQVLSEADFEPIKAIATLPRPTDADSFFGQSAFDSMPLLLNPNPPLVTGDENVVRYKSITVSQVSELQFKVVGNSNPDLVNAAIVNNQLTLNYSTAASRTAEITVQATNLLGQSTQDTFLITVADSVVLPPDPVVPPNISTPGPDQLIGTPGPDRINGLGGNDEISGLDGNDQLIGQKGADLLIGEAGKDRLRGGDGNDDLQGGEGSDRLEGESGKDKITTGGGRDRILIGRQDGLDVVTDFQDRRDRIQLGRGISFNQLSFTQRRKDVLIKVDGTNLLVLEDFKVTALSQADFV